MAANPDNIAKEQHEVNIEEQTQDVEHDGIVTSQAQGGVQDIEAITITWATGALIAAYIMIWIIYFVEGMISGTVGALSPYVTSAFLQQPLLPTVTIISAIIGGVTNLTIAKILDVFGRPQGFLLCIVIALIGLIMMAATNTVEMYAAAQVFYIVGNNGLQYTLSVLVADTSSLRNRGLMQAFASSPYMITCWLAGPISSAFLYGAGWPWAFGMFSILLPVVTLPLYGLLAYHHVRAGEEHVLVVGESRRGVVRSILYHLRELDAVGLLLLSGGVALFLLPFNLYTIQATGWSSPLIICLLVFGIVLLIAFVIWERFFAPVTFVPWPLLKDRTVLGACLLSGVIFFSNAGYISYFSSFLQVVSDLSVTDASYVVQIGTVGGVLAALAIGVFIHYTGRFKSPVLFFALPVTVLAMGLLIYFRQPSGYTGYIVMCQILMAVSSGVITVCDEIAVLAAVTHQHIAVSIAVLGLFGSIGSAVGSTIAAAIYQGVFPVRLAQYLPEDALNNFDMIYGDIATQLSYDVGTPTRLAIQQAYADTWVDLLIPAIAIYALGIIGVLLWRNIDLKTIKQVKGRVV